jgi:hypothetical protein
MLHSVFVKHSLHICIIYIHVCIYVCIYVVQSVCLSVCMYVCMHVCMYVFKYMYVYVHMYVHVLHRYEIFTNVYTCITYRVDMIRTFFFIRPTSTCAIRYQVTHIHTYINTYKAVGHQIEYIHTYIHTYIYTYLPSRVRARIFHLRDRWLASTHRLPDTFWSHVCPWTSNPTAAFAYVL